MASVDDARGSLRAFSMDAVEDQPSNLFSNQISRRPDRCQGGDARRAEIEITKAND
jgi:hypothetical protein